MMRLIACKKELIGTVLCIFSLLFVSACVTTREDVLYLNDQIVALNERVNKLQASTDAKLSKDVDERVSSIRASNAELRAEMDQMRNKIQALSGRLEENAHLVKRSVERDTTDQDVMKSSFADLNKKITEMEVRVNRLYGYLKLESPSEAQGRSETAPPVIAKKPPSQPPSPPTAAQSPEAGLYESSLKDYQAGKYEEAADGFQDFLKKYPKSNLADNAQFWVGECYMALRQYEQAILAYQQVIKNYPKGNKIPNAMLRQALAFHEIKDDISAKLLLKKVVKNYPNTSEAKIAEAKLKSLK